MRTLLPALAAFGLVFLSGPAHAEAPTRSAAPRLAQATASFAQQARAEAPRSLLTQRADRLARVTQRANSRSSRTDRAYRATRRALVGATFQPSDRLLDRWDEVVISYRHRARRQPARDPVAAPRPAPRAAGWFFQGQFENDRVRYVGNSPNAIYQQCRADLEQRNVRRVDDVVLYGRHMRHTSGYFGHQALCSIAILNAEPQRRSSPSARIEVGNLWFKVYGGDADERIATYLPRALNGLRFDEAIVDGQLYRSAGRAWSPYEIASVVRGGLTPDRPARRGAPNRRVARNK